jgi:hypothetical protein
MPRQEANLEWPQIPDIESSIVTVGCNHTVDQPTSMHRHTWRSASTKEGAHTTPNTLDIFAEDCEPFTIQFTDTTEWTLFMYQNKNAQDTPKILSATEGTYIWDESRRNAMEISPPIPRNDIFWDTLVQIEEPCKIHLSKKRRHTRISNRFLDSRNLPTVVFDDKCEEYATMFEVQLPQPCHSIHQHSHPPQTRTP